MDSHKNKGSTAPSTTTKKNPKQSGTIHSFFPRAQPLDNSNKANNKGGSQDKQRPKQDASTDTQQTNHHRVTPTTQQTGPAKNEGQKAGQQHEPPKTPSREGTRDRYAEIDSPNDRPKKQGKKANDGTGDTIMEEAVIIRTHALPINSLTKESRPPLRDTNCPASTKRKFMKLLESNNSRSIGRKRRKTSPRRSNGKTSTGKHPNRLSKRNPEAKGDGLQSTQLASADVPA